MALYNIRNRHDGKFTLQLGAWREKQKLSRLCIKLNWMVLVYSLKVYMQFVYHTTCKQNSSVTYTPGVFTLPCVHAHTHTHFRHAASDIVTAIK